MISKANIKFTKSLQIKKYRKQEQCFVVEGSKSVLELLASDFEPVMVAGSKEFIDNLPSAHRAQVMEVSSKELAEMGEFQTNDSAIAVARMKPNAEVELLKDEYALVLDDIRDPGNLGTIIRTADWYGINKIVASEETVDFYSNKVITSTMGSFTRVKFYYTSLEPYLGKSSNRIMGAFLDGKNVHSFDFKGGGFIVIGNESKGISPAIEKLVTHRITIPRFGMAESLNAGIATAIICDNIRRD